MSSGLAEIARWALVAVFAASVAHKAQDPQRFAKAATSLVGTAPALGGALAAASALAEASLLAGLLLSGGSAAPFAAAIGVLLVYSAAIGIALRRRLAVPCACFHGSRAVRGADLVRNGLLVALAGMGAVGALMTGAGSLTRPAQVVAAAGGLLIGGALTQVSRIMAAIDGVEGEPA